MKADADRPLQGALATLRGSRVFWSIWRGALAARAAAGEVPEAPPRGGLAFGVVASLVAGTGLSAGAAPGGRDGAPAASLRFSSGLNAW